MALHELSCQQNQLFVATDVTLWVKCQRNKQYVTNFKLLQSMLLKHSLCVSIQDLLKQDIKAHKA